jgi:tetratricopeptide (TPR) repeat protein
MRQTAAHRKSRLSLAIALAIATLSTGKSFAQDPTADDIFQPAPTTPNTPAPSTQPPTDTTPPGDAAAPNDSTPAVPPTDTTGPAPSTDVPGVNPPATTPGERPAPREIPDNGREIDPQAKLKLQEAFVEAGTQGGDLKKAIQLALEANQLQRTAHPEARNQLYEASYLVGDILMASGDFEQAVSAFTNAIQANPSQINPYYLLSVLRKSQAHLELKEYRQAESAATDALNFDSQMFEALLLRGKARTELRDYQAAIEDLQEATNAKRNSKEAYTALGKAQMQLGDAASALASLDRAIKLDGMTPPEQKSTYAEPYFERGKLYASTGQLEKAAADLAIAVERDDKKREYLMNLGVLRHEIAVTERDPSQFTLAIDLFNRAIAAPKKPEEEKDVSPMVALARTYIEQGNLEEDKERAKKSYEDAIKTANDALEIEKKAPLAFYQRGVAERMLENYDAAVASFGEALRLAPSLGMAYYRRGIISYHRGDYRLAAQDFDDALRSEPNNPKYSTWRGLTFARQEQFVDAIEAYTNALKFNPLDGRAYHNRALAYLAIDDEEKAISDLNQAIRLNARDAQAYYRRGVVFDRMGESERAISSLSRAIELKSDYADALVARGRLLQRTGDAAKAANDFAAAKKIAPTK